MQAKYDDIGIDYNQTRRADPYLVGRMQHHLMPQAGRQYLDIGCGTGNYTSQIAGSAYEFIGIDPSGVMLEKAKKRNKRIKWQLGTAEKTGLEASSMSGCLASLTIHHWQNLNAAFREVARVLIPGAPMVIFTSTPEQMLGYWLNHYFPRMMADSMAVMPSYELVSEAMEEAGFRIMEVERYFVRPDLRDKFLYCGKEQPALYLQPEIRHGISSFSELAYEAEVQQGLRQLETDLQNGVVDSIMDQYKNQTGDYLFIKAIRATR